MGAAYDVTFSEPFATDTPDSTNAQTIHLNGTDVGYMTTRPDQDKSVVLSVQLNSSLTPVQIDAIIPSLLKEIGAETQEVRLDSMSSNLHAHELGQHGFSFQHVPNNDGASPVATTSIFSRSAGWRPDGTWLELAKTLDDGLDTIKQAYRETPYFKGLSPSEQGTIFLSLDDVFQKGGLYQIRMGKNHVGYVAMEEHHDALCVYAICVFDGHKGQGLGTSTVGALKDRAHQRGQEIRLSSRLFHTASRFFIKHFESDEDGVPFCLDPHTERKKRATPSERPTRNTRAAIGSAPVPRIGS